MARILIIEDEPKVLRSLQRGLQAEGYEVVTAGTGDQGYQLAATRAFDCVLLDLLLPGGRDGLQILADLRKEGHNVAVLILTARDAVEDRVIGLDSGADDYLVKPFALAELLARLRVLLRPNRGQQETVLRASDLEVDLLNRRATRAGLDVPLTQREFEVLVYLMRHKNAVVTRDMLGHEVWKEPNYALTNVIDVSITHLRRKLEKAGQGPLIHTVRGVGYTIRDEPCV